MRTRELLEGVPVFVAVVEASSFTGAAKRLGVSPSAASQAVRALETRIGTPLLSRSTRSVSLTPAGESYLSRISSAYATIEDATREAMGRALQPSGLLRLTMPRAAYDGAVKPALPEFRRNYPLVEFELEIDGGPVDIVDRGFDAALRYGLMLAKDVVSLEVFGPSKSILVAAPSYLKGRPSVLSPQDLSQHDAVICRSRVTGIISSYLLENGGQTFRYDPDRPTIAGDLGMQIDLTLSGHGISCTPAQCARHALESGRLKHVLVDWAAPLQAIHVYFPKRGRANAALQAFVSHLRDRHAQAS